MCKTGKGSPVQEKEHRNACAVRVRAPLQYDFLD
nr:MAG TPA_asm: hypothetical protein [Caudoviricetes sp.]